MKLKSLRLRNFRGYEDVFVEFDEHMSVIIGRNDVGKSTILEALEIFFNNDLVKLELDDLNVDSVNKEIVIQPSFIPSKLEYTVDTIPTNLESEYLLDDQGLITIKQVWDCSKKSITKSSRKQYLIANYPNCFDQPLINLSITDLKKLLDQYSDQLDVKEVKKNTSSSIRQSIYSVADTSDLSVQEISLSKSKSEGEKIYSSLKVDLPQFFLFKSDRANKDSDPEVQGPLKAITKSAIGKLEQDLEDIKTQVEEKIQEIGVQTLDKLREMSPEVANELVPDVDTKAWDSLFSFSFKCEKGVSLNKRGSGVRRLILLNYFRAEAERQLEDGRHVIYAIEEPETSQHPDWQVLLFEALQELSEKDATQVFVTTHSPALAATVKTDGIIFVSNDDGLSVSTGSEVDLQKVVDTLGVLPDIKIRTNPTGVQVIFCVEGVNDVEFFQNISEIFGLDLKNDSRVVTIPLGGKTLEQWVSENYLRKFKVPEIHVYDNDVSSYADSVKEINERADNSWAALTDMYEIENYIHPSLIKMVYPISESFIEESDGWLDEWKQTDVPKSLSAFLKELKKEGNCSIRGEGQGTIKSIFASRAAPLMTKELFEQLDAHSEIEGWFAQIKSRLQ